MSEVFKSLLLTIDEQYRKGGKKRMKTFDWDEQEKAAEAYDDAWRGMVTLCVVEHDEEGNILREPYLHVDSQGRKYIKGSPFYNFPTVPRVPKIELWKKRGWL